MAKKLSKEDFCYELQSGLVVSLDGNDSDVVIDDDSNGRFAFSQDGRQLLTKTVVFCTVLILFLLIVLFSSF